MLTVIDAVELPSSKCYLKKFLMDCCYSSREVFVSMLLNTPCPVSSQVMFADFR